MGWGSGKGKAEVLVPAAEAAIAHNTDPHAFANKIVLIDVSGIAFKGVEEAGTPRGP